MELRFEYKTMPWQVRGRSFQAEGTATLKALGQDEAWYVQGIQRKPLWLEDGGLGKNRG